MSRVRLYILGSLVERGPMHGHALRNLAEEEHLDEWTDISVGSLYGALKRMLAEGLIAVERTERDGNYPERQVYAIAESGVAALRSIREQVFRTIDQPHDPFDLAFSRPDPEGMPDLAAAVQLRLDAYRRRLEDGRRKLERIGRYLWRAERLTLEHGLRRLETEVAWHEELLAQLPDLLDDERERHSRKGRTTAETASLGGGGNPSGGDA